MPTLDLVGATLDLPRNLALLDTNVLVAYQLSTDRDHDQAEAFVEAGADYELLVAPPVLVESCGMLSSRSGRDAVGRLLSWLLTPEGSSRWFR